MTWGWNDGAVADSKKMQTWPRYEAEYLKRALQSEYHKYDTTGLDAEQRQVYLDHVTQDFKEEADECLKAEFREWLQGNHAANDPDGPRIYENADGKPVRRWVVRSPEAEDEAGYSKVGHARAGWEHTPWGRASLTALPGVRQYLRAQAEASNADDLKMQLLAEYGPQDLDGAWRYFKHWVKGRPLSDAVKLPARFNEMAPGARSDFGNQMPNRMHSYNPDPSDRKPQVFAGDVGARHAAVSAPGEPRVRTTTEWEDNNIRKLRHTRQQMETVMNGEFDDAHQGENEIISAAERARTRDSSAATWFDDNTRRQRSQQNARLESMASVA